MSTSLQEKRRWRYRCSSQLLFQLFLVGIVCFVDFSATATNTDSSESSKIDDDANAEEQFVMSFDGFAINVPSAINYKPLYNRYFTNLAHMSMLANYAVIKRVEDTNVECKTCCKARRNSGDRSDSYDSKNLEEMITSRANEEKLKCNKEEEGNSNTTQTIGEYEMEVVGTTQAQHHVQTSILVPLDLSRWSDVNDMCSWSNANRLQAMTSWVESLHIPRRVIATQRANSTLAAVVVTSGQTTSETIFESYKHDDEHDVNNNEYMELLEHKNIQRTYEVITYDVDCLLDVIEEYNSYVAEQHKNDNNKVKNDNRHSEEMDLFPISTVILNAETNNNNNSNNSNGDRILLRKRKLIVNEQPHEMHRRVSMNVILYKELLIHTNEWDINDKVISSTNKQNEEEQLERESITKNALFNARRWMNGYVFPYYALQVRNNLNLLINNQSSRTEHWEMEKWKESKSYSNITCLTQSTFMEDGSYACAPLGGWTHWTSTQNTSWAYDSTPQHSFIKHTPENSVALFVSANEWSLVPEMASPGADGTVSAMSAAFVIIDAITRYNSHSLHKPISLYVFWVPGEYYGHVGSARIIHDAQHLQCDNINNENIVSGINVNENNHICTNGIYKDYLNVTSIDFTKFSTIVALDQLSFSPRAPLYVHVDDRVLHASSVERSWGNSNLNESYSDNSKKEKSTSKENSAMKHVLQKLQETYNISRADTHHLRFSPVTTYIDLLPEKLDTQVIFTLARYNTEYINPFVFTPSDVADNNNSSEYEMNNSSDAINAIAEAAQVIVDLILDLTREENMKQDSEHVRIDHDLLHNLWHCLTIDVHCEYLKLASTFPECAAINKIPNYATHTFTFTPRQTSSECVIASVLHKLQLSILVSPALSPMLNLSLSTPTLTSSSPWHWVEKNHSYIAHLPEKYRHVHVISTWPVNGIAARVATVASS